MGLIVRDVAVARQQPPTRQLAVIAEAISPALITAAVAPYQRPWQRCRKLPLATLVLVVLGMSLYTQSALAVVYRRVVGGLHRSRQTAAALVSRSALCQGRARLGVRPLVALFHQVARPLADTHTPGAFLWGMRLLALDGTKEVVPDTPANARAFGRPGNQQGPAAYPQVLGIYLVEVGTHAVLDAGFWPCHTPEHVGRRLLRALPTGANLLLADAGFYSYALVAHVLQRPAHALIRLPSGVKLHHAHALPDGTQLGTIYPSQRAQRQDRDGVRVRVLTYRLTDPARPHAFEVQRLVTTLLDPQQYPALDLVCAYHERWEIELLLDELACHQRPAEHPLRSQTPLGVLQELYGLLLVHYALRALMLEAARQHDLDPDRLSFARTVQLVRESIPEFQASAPATHRRLRALLLADIAACRLPPRALRTNPRVVKRQQSKFLRKRPDHRGIPPLTQPFRQIIALILPALDVPPAPPLLTLSALPPPAHFLPI